MNGKIGEDYKYVIQDTSRVLLGAKYSYAELLEDASCPFKFQSIVEHYILKDADPSDTLESVFYYMEKGSFSSFMTSQNLSTSSLFPSAICRQMQNLSGRALTSRIMSPSVMVYIPLI